MLCFLTHRLQNILETYATHFSVQRDSNKRWCPGDRYSEVLRTNRQVIDLEIATSISNHRNEDFQRDYFLNKPATDQ